MLKTLIFGKQMTSLPPKVRADDRLGGGQSALPAVPRELPQERERRLPQES